MKKVATQAWCEVFLEKLKTLDEEVTFKELKNQVWDDPDARPSLSVKHARYKMTNMPMTGHNWGMFCKRHDNVIVSRKVSHYSALATVKEGYRPRRLIHYKWCQHIDFTDTLDGAVCNDCGIEVAE